MVRKKVVSTEEKVVSPQLLYSENKNVSTVFPSRCFHPKTEEYLATATSLNGTSFYGFCTVFQRSCLNGLEKNVCTMFQQCFSSEKESYYTVKKVFPKFFNMKKKMCFNGVCMVRKKNC